MSKGEKQTYRKVLAVANHIVEALQEHCERIEIAGSLRRKRQQIGDIEIVAIPRRQLTLFGEPDLTAPTAVDRFLKEKNVTLIKDGPRNKQFEYGPYTVDLYLPTGQTWGSIFTLRTGSHDFNMWIMTQRAVSVGVRFDNGRLYARGQTEPLETPEESDVFTALQLPFIPPEYRDGRQWLEYIESMKELTP